MQDHVVEDAETGFTDFVRRHQTSLVQLCWALTGDRQLGEDLAQAALARLWPRWTRVSGTGDPWPYLQRVAVSIASTWRRRRWNREIPTAPAAEARDGRDALANVHANDNVERWLALLPARQRAVIVLRFLFDLSVVETADRLRCSPGTVKSQTAKALTTLRARADFATEQTGVQPS